MLSQIMNTVNALQQHVFGSQAPKASHPPPPTASLSRPLTLADMRKDDTLAAQASKMVEKLDLSGLGAYSYSKAMKRGWARAGGEDAPLVPTPWPQDHIIGHGFKQRLMYLDLDIYQWIQGILIIMEREPNVIIKNLMLSYFVDLFHDAQFHGWDTVKYAHGVVLSGLENGAFTWHDITRMSDVRRSALVARSVGGREAPTNVVNKDSQGSKGVSNSNNYASGGAHGVSRPSKQSRKPAKACNFHNNGSCAHPGDHENATTRWRHVCKECWSRDHIERDCPLSFANFNA
jgi:hypothetical protein